MNIFVSLSALLATGVSVTIYIYNVKLRAESNSRYIDIMTNRITKLEKRVNESDAEVKLELKKNISKS